MSFSNIYSNFIFCGVLALLIYLFSSKTSVMVFKKGVPFLVLIIVVSLKMLIPIEFRFTRPIASKNLLPFLQQIKEFAILPNFTIGMLVRIIWILGSCILFLRLLYQSNKIYRIFSFVPHTDSKFIHTALNQICSEKNIKAPPKVISLEGQGPFIIGVRKPIIVIPTTQFLDSRSIRFILSHELEHLKGHHLYIKAFIELLSVIFWWNPITWFLKKSTIHLLEIQADIGVTEHSREEDHLLYAECLLSLAKRLDDPNYSMKTALCFSMSKVTITQRVEAILEHKKRSQSSSYRMLGMATLLIVLSALFVLEPYMVDEEQVQGAFLLDVETDYWIHKQNGGYDLYVDGVYAVNFHTIPDELPKLTIINEA